MDISMYDLHSHILPNVDDGAKTQSETMEMLRVAASDGTKIILATPHRKDITERSSVPHIQELASNTNRAIQEEGLNLTLALGMENHLDIDLPKDVEEGRALPINNSKYILVEMPWFGRPIYLEQVLFEIQAMGLTPILAHPERLEIFQSDPEFLVNLVERGMLTQITAGSLLGYFNRNVRKFTVQLFKNNLVHILASDCHFSAGTRSPKLSPGFDAAVKLVGYDRAAKMVIDLPKAILNDQTVSPPIPESNVKWNKNWWEFWL